MIERALKSIPVRADIEIIVVDDLSTEDSIKKTANKEEFSHVIFIFPGEKITSGGARNIGIENSSGKYLLCVDSDDYLAENAFNVFDKITESGKELYQFRAESFLEESGEIGTGTRLKHFKKYYEMENKEGLLSIGTPWAKLFQRKFIEKHHIRFSEVPPNHGDDIYFSTQAAVYAQTFEFSEEIVYFVSQSVSNNTGFHDTECYIGLLKETIKCTKLIKKTKIVNSFRYFKDVKHRRWIDIALQLNDQHYSELVETYKSSLPANVRFYWDVLHLFGKLQSPQLHFSSSRNIDICYVLRPGKTRKLIVNFNDFGIFDEDESEANRFPYFFVNTFRKTKQSLLDIRDFWGVYGVWYYQHNGNRIDKDIQECLKNAMSILELTPKDVLLFGIGKGASAALHFAQTFDYPNCVAISPYSTIGKGTSLPPKVKKRILMDIFGNGYRDDDKCHIEFFDKELVKKSDSVTIYSDVISCNNSKGKMATKQKTQKIKRLIKTKVLTF